MKQAQNDLLWAKDSLTAGHFSGACFVAQQVAEESLKAVAYLRGADIVKGHPLRGLSREQFLGRLKEAMTGRASECCVFGSFAVDSMTHHSDVDLIIVKETTTPFLNRAQEFGDLYDIGPQLDVLVYTPEEFRSLIHEPVGFWKSVRESMIRIS